MPISTSVTTVRDLVAEIDPHVSPGSSWPIFPWLGQQVGNFQTLGVVVMVAVFVCGVIKWVSGASSDNSRSQTGGKVMVFGSIVGGIVIAAAPALIRWATGQNPLG